MNTRASRSITSKHALRITAAAALCALAGAAQAQISRGFIAPHEYALPPGGFEPFNVFVEYTTLQKSDRVWNSAGNKTGANDTEVLVSLSKYVRAWTPDFNRDMGLIFEIVVPKVGVRDKTAGTSTGGIGDSIFGPAIWYRPVPEWTLGADFLIQAPIGDADVGGGDRWNLITSAFWDAQYGKFNYTGDFGIVVPGSPTAGVKPGKVWFTNHRFGYRVSELLEPYVGLDYERQESTSANPSNDESGFAAGVMFHIFKNTSIALHYQGGLKGENRAVSDNLNMRVVYVF